MKHFISNKDRDTLDVMNYQVSLNAGGHYYLQDGYAGLVRYAARHEINIVDLLRDLLSSDHQWVGISKYDGKISITMI